MSRRRVSQILGLLLATVAWAGLAGRPLAPGAGVPGARPLLQDADTLVHLGDDGPPAWFWPNLPGSEAVYRREFTAPRRFELLGLLVGTAGTAGGDTLGTLDITLRDASGAVLLDSTNARVGGGAARGFFALDRPPGEEIIIEGGSTLLVDLRSDHLDEDPWPTADDDCHDGGRSWIRAPAASPDFQLLERDLNIRALGRWTEGDQTPPVIRAADALAWSRQRAGLPLRVRVRDEGGIDSVWALSPELPGWRLDLARLGHAPADTTWQEWSALLEPAALLPEPATSLALEVLARDSLGNTASRALELAVEEPFHWSAAGNRADQSWQPGQPLTPGSALALRVPLARIRAEGALLTARVTGARLRLAGPGQVLLRLVRNVQGRPAATDTGWVDLAEPVLATAAGNCPAPLEVDFTLNALGQSQGDAVWLLLDYSLPSHLSQAPAPLLEWFEPDSAGVEDAADSWSYAPLEEQWNPIPAGRLLIEPLIEAQGCDFAVPFLADFDSYFAGLQCWSRTRLNSPFDPGWQSTAEAQANPASADGRCFFPDAAGTFVPPGLEVDPRNLSSGHILFVNSDVWGLTGVQTDSLFTPWLEYDDGALLSFSTLAGGAADDSCRVLLQHRTGGVAGPYELILSDDNPADSLYVPGAMEFCDIPHGLWTRVSRELAPAGSAGELRVVFAYHGQYGNGWALDSVRVDPAPTPSPWHGPQTAAAEIGRAFPNPFNPATVIPYRLQRGGPARLEVFNLRGQRVAVLVDEPRHRAGSFRAVFHPEGLASGIYLARLEAGGAVDTRRLVYLK